MPLATFMKILKNALAHGYLREPRRGHLRAGEERREEGLHGPDLRHPARVHRRLRPASSASANGATTDDHGIHLIGYKETKGGNWFLIKDSGSSSFNAEPKGYYFLTEDYVKLKMMDFMVHKDALKGIVEVK